MSFEWPDLNPFDDVGEWFRSELRAHIAGAFRPIWNWFIEYLPDFAGYGVVAAGAFMMIAPVASRGGMMKPLGILAGGLILTVCILAAN